MANRIILVILVLQLAILLSNSISVTPQNSKKWYYISNTHETWYDALSNCRSLKMKLLEVDSAEKNQQLQSYFKRRAYGTSTVNGFQILNYWTAGHNINRLEMWVWRVSEKRATFTAWAPGQPDNNNYYGSEYCIELLYFTNTDLLWNDSNCLIKKQYICESL